MVRKDPRAIIQFFAQITLAWTFAWLLFYCLRQLGIDEFPYVVFSKEPSRLMHLTTHGGIGILTGMLYSITELFFERPYFQRHSYGRLILLKTIIYFLIALVLMTLTVISVQNRLFGTLNWIKVIDWLTSISFTVALIYFIIVSFLLSFFRQLNYKFGPGELRKMLVGKYHRPREEERIFMFLDMQSSTTIAEKLGHIRFSRLLQDCFFDLTNAVITSQADIYQYVGDEAVLCWELKKGLTGNRCLHCYFDFANRLQERMAYYQAEYGLQPFFKAGLHNGKVTVAEVGVIKKEIAYHGDVLNTAARIQSKCNELGQAVLVSADLKHALPPEDSLNSFPIDKMRLRGKRMETEIYAVEKRKGSI